jgi:predicted O-methyltransferase YrrM
VLHGPFAGMEYPDSAVGRVHHLTAKLLGAYERELAPLLPRRPRVFVDIGAADGYYAVGFALASPSTVVHAFEVDPVAKRVLRASARLNRVADRVVLHGPANARRLASIDLRDALVLCDVEGAEVDVLAGEALPALAGATVLVEVHPLGDGDTGPPLRERFEPTHTVRAIEPEARDARAYPELAALGADAGVLDEARFGRTIWLLFEPRQPGEQAFPYAPAG